MRKNKMCVHKQYTVNTDRGQNVSNLKKNAMQTYCFGNGEDACALSIIFYFYQKTNLFIQYSSYSRLKQLAILQ